MISAVTNTSGLSALHWLQRNQEEQKGVLTRLATGKRINSGKDGPADLIAAERLAAELVALQAQTRGLQRFASNTNITEGHLGEFSTLARDVEGLIVASANSGAMTDAEIAANQGQVDSAVSSMQGTLDDAMASLESAGLSDDKQAELEQLLTDASTALATVTSGGANSLSSGNLEAAQQAIEQASGAVASVRGEIGAYQKYEIEPSIRSNQVAFENLSESKSRISDTDYAVETSRLTRSRILTEVGVKVLKIAQQEHARVLSLLS